MSLPGTPNQTCDLFHNAGGPAGDPDVAGVSCVLVPHFARGSEASAGTAAVRFTHLLLVELGVDVRDHYTGAGTLGANFDYVYVPDKNGTKFKVVFVERVDRNLPTEHKRAYLDRQAVTWPSSNL